MKNYKKFMTIAAIASTLLLLTSCGPKNQHIVEIPDNYSGDATKVTDVISFNFSTANILATTGNKNNSRSARLARAAKDELSADDYDSLIAITEDDKVVNVMDTDPQLKDDCVPNKVIEIYQCPYSNVEAECKGVYTVFDGWIDWWEYTDGTKAPNISMLLYVKPDGTVVDILNFDNDVYHYVQTYIKANDGNDYIQFDTAGNAYILADDGGNSVVYRYSPTNDAITKYDLGLKSDKQNVWIGNYEVTADGKWIFVRANLNQKDNELAASTVYAMQVNSDKEPIEIFNTGIDGGWVQTLTYNNTNNTLYFYVWSPQGEEIRNNTGNIVSTTDRADKGTQLVGLYTLERDSAGNFDSKNLKRHYKLSPWAFWNVASQLLMENAVLGQNEKDEDQLSWKAKDSVTDEDYKKFLDWIKSQTSYQGSKEDIIFDLSFFSSDVIKNAKRINEEGKEEPYINPGILKRLYKKDAEGNVLSEVAALKYLLNVEKNEDYWIHWQWEENGEEFKDAFDKTLMTALEWAFWDWEKYVRSDDDKKNGKYSYFLQAFLHHKDGKTPLFDDYYTGPAEFTSNNSGGICVCNDEGIWNFVDRGHEDPKVKAKWITDYSIAYQLTDRKGNFILQQPDAIEEKNFYKISEDIPRVDSDPWYKRPFETTPEGFAAISGDGRTIYYYSNGKITDLLENDENKDNISSIYAFTISDDKLVYNAVNKRRGYMMVSIDRTTNIARKLPLTVCVESILDKK